MKTFTKAALLAAIAAPAIFVAAPAAAQAVPGIAVADLNEAVQKSNAYVAAMQSIQVTYKAQIDQTTARRTTLQAELKPLVDAFEAARRVPNANQQTLQTQAQTIQQREQAGQAELQRLFQPVGLAQAYVNEQIVSKIEAALDRAMAKKRISIVLLPDATVKSLPTARITQDVIAELNATVPSVQTVPPQGWRPGQAGAAAPGQPAAQPQTQPPGR